MSNKLEPKSTPGQPVVYQIRIKGHLSPQWADWFEGLSITLEEDGNTLLTGTVIDQAALHGLLKKVRDLGMPLVSVSQVQFNETHPYRLNKEKRMNTNKKTSLAAGFWYLLVAIFGSFNTMFVESKLVVPDNVTATLNNILESERLFRFGIMSNLVTTICFLLLANSLYKLFKPVDKDLVRLMVIFIISSVPHAYLQMLKFAPILLLGSDAYLSAFEPAQLQALAMSILDMYKQGVFITYIFYGLWMFPLGLLVFKSRSGFTSKLIGVLLMVGCFGYLSKFLEVFLSLSYQAITSSWMTVTIIAEILCIVWLFVKGPEDRKPDLIR